MTLKRIHEAIQVPVLKILFHFFFVHGHPTTCVNKIHITSVVQ